MKNVLFLLMAMLCLSVLANSQNAEVGCFTSAYSEYNYDSYYCNSMISDYYGYISAITNIYSPNDANGSIEFYTSDPNDATGGFLEWYIGFNEDISHFLPATSDSIVPFSFRHIINYDGFVQYGGYQSTSETIASDNNLYESTYFTFDEFSSPGTVITATRKMIVPSELTFPNIVDYSHGFMLIGGVSNVTFIPGFQVSGDIDFTTEIVLPQQFYIDNPTVVVPTNITVNGTGNIPVALECVSELDLRNDTLSAVIYSAVDILCSSFIGENKVTSINGESSVTLLSGFSMLSGSGLNITNNPLSCTP